MSDRGHELTDEMLKRLEKKIAKEYRRTNKEVFDKLSKYFSQFEAEDNAERKRYEAGEITKARSGVIKE